MMNIRSRCEFSGCSEFFDDEDLEWIHQLNAHKDYVRELPDPPFAMVCPGCRAGKYATHPSLLDHIDAAHGGRI